MTSPVRLPPAARTTPTNKTEKTEKKPAAPSTVAPPAKTAFDAAGTTAPVALETPKAAAYVAPTGSKDPFETREPETMSRLEMAMVKTGFVVVPATLAAGVGYASAVVGAMFASSPDPTDGALKFALFAAAAVGIHMARPLLELHLLERHPA